MSFPRRRESRKIKALDPRLRGDDEYFSASLALLFPVLRLLVFLLLVLLALLFRVLLLLLVLFFRVLILLLVGHDDLREKITPPPDGGRQALRLAVGLLETNTSRINRKT